MKAVTETREEILLRDGLIPASKAAELAGITLQAMHRRLSSGKLLGTRVGEHWYVSVRALAEMHAGAPKLHAAILALLPKAAR